MLKEIESLQIRAKMKRNKVFGADFARKFNVSRQAIQQILAGKDSNKKIEKFLLEWKDSEN